MANATPQQSESGSGQGGQYVHTGSTVHSQGVATRTAAQFAAFLLPHLRSGMSLLDCGCGPGTITLGLAEAVSPGQVVGIDIEEANIDRARAHAAEQGIPNVRFEVGSVYELPFPDDSFDAVFANTLLEHLEKPAEALNEMRRVLKPGGVVGVSEGDWGSFIIAPPDPLLDQFHVIYQEFLKIGGSNPQMGRHVRGLVDQAGFVRVEVSASCQFRGTPDATQRFGENLANRFEEPSLVERVIEHGLADRATLEEISAAWRTWAKHPHAFFALTLCEAVGWKE